MPSLPLFPLGTVLFPGGQLPLQIFEPRYVRLLRDLVALPQPEQCFGVVAIRQGHEVGEQAARHLYPVGCEAHLEAVAGVQTPDGQRYQARSTGRRRFVLEGLEPGTGNGYLVGQVRWLPGVDAADDTPDLPMPRRAALEDSVRTAAQRYAAALRGHAPALSHLTGTELAYRAAEAMVLDLADRQAVLAAPDAEAALRLVGRLARQELGLVTTLRAVPAQGTLTRPGVN